MIYIISNVDYPEERKIHPNPEDMLVFLNKAKTASYYAAHPNHRKMCIRRSPELNYGSDLPGIDNRFIFAGPPDKTVPGEIINRLKQSYDWDYEIEKGKIKCATTGYMAVKYLEATYPDEEIVLVNFGYEVKKSSYRCPWHNWRFEAKALSGFRHIFTADKTDHDHIEIVYCCDQNYLDTVKMSAESVLRHNPNAHISVVSERQIAGLPCGFENIVFPLSDYKLRTTNRISKSAYLRMFLPEILKSLSKVIYLDGDTLCRGSLNDLWRRDIEFIGACHSHDTGRRQAEEIGIELYHIDAVMLMNLAALRSMNFTKIAAWAAEHFVMPKTRFYCAETVLNACFNDIVETLPTKWCYCMNRSYKSYNGKNEQENSNTACMRHYIGGQIESMRRDAQKSL